MMRTTRAYLFGLLLFISSFQISAQFEIKSKFSSGNATASKIINSDLNFNNFPDLLSVSSSSGQVNYFENIDGDFQDPIELGVCNSCSDIITVDVDDDGELDVVFSSPDDQKIYWVKMISGVVSGTQAVLINAGEVNSFSWDYIDDDQYVDYYVATNNKTGIDIYYGTNNVGVFNKDHLSSVDIIKKLAPVKLGGSGAIRDLVYITKSSNKLAFFKNNDNRNFSGPNLISNSRSNPIDFESIYYNSGSSEDLIVGYGNSKDEIILFNNQGGGSFTEVTLAQYFPHDDLEVVYSQNQNDKLIVAGELAEGVDIIDLGDYGSFNFEFDTTIINEPAVSLSVADIDNDGDIDFAASITNNFDEIWILENNEIRQVKGSIDTGISEYNSFRMFPNPSRNNSLKLNFINSASRTISIYNTLGKRVLIKSSETNAVSLKLSLAPGSYIIKVNEGDRLLGVQPLLINK